MAPAARTTLKAMEPTAHSGKWMTAGRDYERIATEKNLQMPRSNWVREIDNTAFATKGVSFNFDY
jgi:hypothetical protein